MMPQQDMMTMFMQWMMQMMQSQMPQMMMQWMQQQNVQPTAGVRQSSCNEKAAKDKKPENDGNELLTEKQVAAILKVNAVTLWRMNKDGRLPRHKIGGTVVRYKKSEVDAYINSKGRDHV